VHLFASAIAARLNPFSGIDLAEVKSNAVASNAVAVVEEQEEGKQFVHSIS
jgi:hypothetical protein